MRRDWLQTATDAIDRALNGKVAARKNVAAEARHFQIGVSRGRIRLLFPLWISTPLAVALIWRAA